MENNNEELQSKDIVNNDVIDNDTEDAEISEKNLANKNEEKNETVKKEQNADISDDDLTGHRQYTIEENEKKKKIKMIVIIIFSILIGICILFTAICAFNRLNNNVYKNVYIFGENISNYTSDQVVKLVEEKVKTINDSLNISVYQDDKDIYNIKPDNIDFSIDAQKTSSNVMAFGRKDNFIIDNFKILKALILKQEIVPEYTYSSEKLDSVIKNIDLTIENRYSDDTYSVDEVKNLLTITRGKSGNGIDYDKTKTDVINILKSFKSTNYSVNIIAKEPSEINLDELYSKVKREATDAYIDNATTPPTFVDEKLGYDVDMNKLKDTLNTDANKAEGATIEFPLTVINPKIKLSDITYTLYNDKLAGYTTYFDSSQKSRANNLEVALRYINGAIVMPGKTFSYYERVGEITADKGYQDAATFKGGTVVYEVGGGVCQTSSTLYNVALLANLEIVERHQHGLPVGYVPPSRDATIYGNVLDFKFKNTRKYPIKIVTSYSAGGNINISIYGTKEKDEYEVSLSQKVLYYIPFTTKYVYDSTLSSGTSIVMNKGVNGYASESYITKKLNGSVVSSALLSKDVYNAQQQVMKVGTKVEPVPVNQNNDNNNVNVY